MTNDQWINRAIVVMLGVSLIMAIGLSGVVYLQGKNPPEFLVTVGTAIIGGLLGALGARPHPNTSVDNADEVNVTTGGK